jgi:hypothetical protein
MIFRGALVGLAFAGVHHRLNHPQISLYFLMFSIWLTTWSYMTIRGGTLILLHLIQYRIIIPFVGVLLLTRLLTWATPALARRFGQVRFPRL